MAHTIRCGNCTSTHRTAAQVAACHRDELFSCYWTVQRTTVFDGELITAQMDCGADAIATDRGWTCDAGHEHVTAEARHAEGWDYAEDAGEALNLTMSGVQPYTMQGHTAFSPRCFDHA